MPTPDLDLRAGEWVQVRSKDEILRTLDANGRLDELPFMPEMLRYCGQTLRVGKRAHKTCDPAMGLIGRGMASTVHLENIRCDGAAHDGCEAQCLIFWKEAWLKRVEPGQASIATPPATHNGDTPPATCTEETLISATRLHPAVEASGGEPTYLCQNTQVKFASHPLRWWDARQYVEDYTSGNVSVSQLVNGMIYTVWRTFTEAGIGLGTAMRWLYDIFQHAIGGFPYPVRPYGVKDGARTPKVLLDLRVGERVRVKPHGEILKTLDSRYRNRGLYFDPDYVPFTGKEFQVSRRVKRIIDERDGKMIHFKTDAIVLDSVVCEGRYAMCRRFCPRAIVPYWREIWLERVPGSTAAHDEVASPVGAAATERN